MKWEKVATIKFQAGATFGFTSGRTRPRFERVAIWLAGIPAETVGLKRMLKCGCTQAKTYHYDPEKLEAPYPACIHIRALYGNGTVTDDDVHIGAARATFSGPGFGPRHFGKVYLTPLGREMFNWRHVAQALE